MKYSVGIIGLGRIAWTLEDERQRRSPATHAEAFRQNLSTELAAASSSRREVLDSFGKKYGVSQLFEDYREMLEKVDLDIVAVCTHIPLHHQMVLDAARRGVRAIFCEKPLSSSLEEADEMIDACRKSKTLLLVNHTRESG